MNDQASDDTHRDAPDALAAAGTAQPGAGTAPQQPGGARDAAGTGGGAGAAPADAGHEPAPIDLAEQSIAGEEDPGAAFGEDSLPPGGLPGT